MTWLIAIRTTGRTDDNRENIVEKFNGELSFASLGILVKDFLIATLVYLALIAVRFNFSSDLSSAHIHVKPV